MNLFFGRPLATGENAEQRIARYRHTNFRP